MPTTRCAGAQMEGEQKSSVFSHNRPHRAPLARISYTFLRQWKHARQSLKLASVRMGVRNVSRDGMPLKLPVVMGYAPQNMIVFAFDLWLAADGLRACLMTQSNAHGSQGLVR